MPLLPRSDLREGGQPRDNAGVRNAGGFQPPEDDWGRGEIPDEAEELSRRLEALGVLTEAHAWSLRSQRTSDGLRHVVSVDPFTEATAERVREAASPTAVIVEPYA